MVQDESKTRKCFQCWSDTPFLDSLTTSDWGKGISGLVPLRLFGCYRRQLECSILVSPSVVLYSIYSTPGSQLNRYSNTISQEGK